MEMINYFITESCLVGQSTFYCKIFYPACDSNLFPLFSGENVLSTDFSLLVEPFIFEFICRIY